MLTCRKGIILDIHQCRILEYVFASKQNQTMFLKSNMILYCVNARLHSPTVSSQSHVAHENCDILTTIIQLAYRNMSCFPYYGFYITLLNTYYIFGNRWYEINLECKVIRSENDEDALLSSPWLLVTLYWDFTCIKLNRTLWDWQILRRPRIRSWHDATITWKYWTTEFTTNRLPLFSDGSQYPLTDHPNKHHDNLTSDSLLIGLYTAVS